MKRIQIVRKKMHLSQKELADKLNLSQQSISYYESGKKTPSDDILSKIAMTLDVPPEYLKEEIDSIDGWDLWEKNTGLERDQIEKEIARLISSHRLKEDDSLQKKISIAVKFLLGFGNTDKNAVLEAKIKVSEIGSYILKNYYEDPNKFVVAHQKNGKFPILTTKDNDGSLFFNDMNKDVFFKISEILQNARNELSELANKIND